MALPEVRDASTVLCYVSSKDNEVDTHGLIAQFVETGRRVFVPIAEPGGIMLWSQLLELDELAPARFGILEPRPESRRISPAPPDALVLVPGIAFSPDGHRIGYGGGYYDRFLAGHEGPAIGLAFDVQIICSWETNEYDIPVKAVVTETRLIQRRSV